jgi:O-antigen ligase
MKILTYNKLSEFQLWICITFAALLCILPKLYLNILIGALFILSLIKFVLHLNHNERKKVNKKLFLFTVLPFFIIVLIFIYDITTTYNLKNGVLELEKKASFLIFPLIFYLDPFLLNGRLKKVVNAFALGCISVVLISHIYALYRVFFQNFSTDISSNWDNINKSSATGDLVNMDPFFYKEFLSLFSISPVYFSTYLIFTIATLFYLYFYKINNRYSKSKKVLISVAIFILLIALIQLSVRGIILPFFLLASLFFVVFLYKKTSLPKMILIILISSLVLILFIYKFPILKYRLYDQLKGTITDYHQEKPNSIKLRVIEYNCSWDVFLSSPIFGHGHKKSDELLYSCLSQNLPKPYRHNFNAHNQYLQYLIQIGIIGLVLFLSPFFFPFFYFKKGIYFYAIFVIVILISFLSESIFSRFYGFMFILYFYILFLSHLLKVQNEKSV